MPSDIIHYRDGRKGRLISAECHIVRSAQPYASLRAEEQMLAAIWPDWPERVLDFINQRIGPCTDPSVLYDIRLGSLIEATLIWAGSVASPENIEAVCIFLGGRLNINPETPNQPHNINAREICKSALLWTLAELGKKSK